MNKVGNLRLIAVSFVLLIYCFSFVAGLPPDNNNPSGTVSVVNTGSQTGQSSSSSPSPSSSGLFGPFQSDFKITIDKVTHSFSFSANEDVQVWIVKIFLMILLALITYTVIDGFFAGHPTISKIVSGIVGILGFIFVQTGWIAAIVTTYEALGIGATSILPFIVCMLLDYRIRNTIHPPWGGVLARGMWTLVLLYLVLQLSYLFFYGLGWVV